MVNVYFDCQLKFFFDKNHKRALYATFGKVMGNGYNKWKVWKKFVMLQKFGTSATIIPIFYFPGF